MILFGNYIQCRQTYTFFFAHRNCSKIIPSVESPLSIGLISEGLHLLFDTISFFYINLDDWGKFISLVFSVSKCEHYLLEGFI